jgi:hypothetical protein
LAAGFLGGIAALDRDPRHMEYAKRYAELCAALAPASFRHDYSGKACWAFALLAASGQGQSYRSTAIGIADHLASRQKAEGCWHSLDPDPGFERRTDLTAEYCFWLGTVGLLLVDA